MESASLAPRETRKAPRRDAALVPGIAGIRLSPHGAAARLVNISTSGALVETPARIQPGCSVTLQFEGGFEPAVVESRVARSTIVAVGPEGRLHYQIGVAFKSPIPLEDLPDACVDRSSAAQRRDRGAAAEANLPTARETGFPIAPAPPAPPAFVNRW